MSVDLAVLLFVHTRAHQLTRIARMLDYFRRERRVHVLAHLNEPSDEVRRIVDSDIRPDARVEYTTTGIGLKERFSERINELLRSHIDPLRPTWVLFQPDDWWFPPSEAARFVSLMNNPDVDVIYTEQRYFWSPSEVAVNLFRTCDPVAWRWRPGMLYDPDIRTPVPFDLVEEARVRNRTACVTSYDFGFSTPEDREAVWCEAKRNGKIDQFTLQVLTTPRLEQTTVEDWT